VNYGQGYKAIAERNGLDPQFVRDALQARGDTFHVQAVWTETVRDRAERGLLLDNGFGRPMRCNPDRAYTQAPALMGQGASRDVMCESLLRLVERDPSVTARLRGFVHDEVVLSVPEADVAYWTQVLEDAFTWEWRGVPILCEVGTPAYRWSDCK
jgi:DNA polymerase-1